MNTTHKEGVVRFLKTEICVPDGQYSEGYNDGIKFCINSIDKIPEIPYFYLLKNETKQTVIDLVRCLYESQVKDEK